MRRSIWVKREFLPQAGASLTEYAMILALLLGVFIVAGILIREKSQERANTSMTVSSQPVPQVDSNSPLCQTSPDACK